MKLFAILGDNEKYPNKQNRSCMYHKPRWYEEYETSSKKEDLFSQAQT